MIKKTDLNKLNRLAEAVRACEQDRDEAEAAMKALLGWDFTFPDAPHSRHYLAPDTVFPDNVTPPDNPKLLGYISFLLNQGHGFLSELYRKHLRAQSYSYGTNEAIDALYEADAQTYKKGNCEESELKTLYHRAEWWEDAYRFKDNACSQRFKPVDEPLTSEQAEELLRLNDRYLLAYFTQSEHESKIEELLWAHFLRDKESYEAAKTWKNESGLFLYMMGGSEVGDHWSGKKVFSQEILQGWRDARLAPVRPPVGTVGVSPNKVAAGTYLKSQKCGCIYRRMSGKEERAMVRRRGGGINSQYNIDVPYMRLVQPSQDCLIKTYDQNGRYKLGAHYERVGGAVWDYDAEYDVVAKPEKFDSRATKDSHPELREEYRRR